MFSCALQLALGFLYIAYATGALQTDIGKCNCLAFCDKKHPPPEQETPDTPNAVCRLGCHMYIKHRPPIRATRNKNGLVASGATCISSCQGLFAEKSVLLDVCQEGCNNGCWVHLPHVKLTILVEDEVEDGSEIEQMLMDPVFSHDKERASSKKNKIPSSSFVNMPVVGDPAIDCKTHPGLCDISMTPETFICAMLLIFAMALVIIVGCRGERNYGPEFADHLFPEKFHSELDV